MSADTMPERPTLNRAQRRVAARSLPRALRLAYYSKPADLRPVHPFSGAPAPAKISLADYRKAWGLAHDGAKPKGETR